MRALVLALSFFCASVFAQTSPVAAETTASPPAYRVIVNPANDVTSVERRFLEDAFLKKTTRWPNGEVIRPVDLGGDSAVREKFSEDVLRRSTSAVRSYWQQQIFSGRDIPPPELRSDDEVVGYVLRHPGAVGYVSGASPLRDARAISVE